MTVLLRNKGYFHKKTTKQTITKVSSDKTHKSKSFRFIKILEVKVKSPSLLGLVCVPNEPFDYFFFNLTKSLFVSESQGWLQSAKTGLDRRLVKSPNMKISLYYYSYFIAVTQIAKT